MSGCQRCGAELPTWPPSNRQRKWCSARCRKAQYDRACVDCGARVDGTSPSSLADPSQPRCLPCATALRRVWTEDAIVDAIRRWVAANGDLPTATEWRIADGRPIPNTATVQRVFGSWTAGMKAAGFTPRRWGQRRNAVAA